MGTHEKIGVSDEWYTPKYIFDELGCTFDLDVASPVQKTFVPAISFITEDSLTKNWYGFIWMNPPFGGRNGITPWINKFLAHGNGIALTPDRSSAPWWQKAAKNSDAILFLSPKVKFMRPDGSYGASPANGTTLFAIGKRGVDSLIRAHNLGYVARGALERKKND